MINRIAIITDAKPVQVGSPEEIFEKPVDIQVSSFIRFENILKCRVISSDHGLQRSREERH